MNILVAGAGNVGRYLARILIEADHTVSVIERDEPVVERARQESGARVIHGDASEPSLLEKAGIRGVDVVVAATGDDEDNIVVANLAKFEFEVPRVVARVKNALNTWLYEPDIGIDVVVSAPHTIAQLIEEQVIVGDVVQLLRLPEGQGAIVETTLPPHSQLIDRSIAEISWPEGCVTVAIVRDSQILPASAETRLNAADRLICLTDVTQAEALHHLVAEKPPADE
jgi:trk system potassium uptake protein TrkA